MLLVKGHLPLDTYSEFVDGLRKSMLDDYIAVSSRRNPVATQLNGMCPDSLAYVIQQYSWFPRKIVSFLCEARAVTRAAGWHRADRELTRNLGEELGSETEGTPHAEVLLRGLERGLGLETVRDVQPTAGTLRFLAKMRESFASTEDVACVAGAAYALEASAVPELDIVWRVVRHYAMLKVRDQGHDYRTLAVFFDLHLNVWEPGHEAGLRKACRTQLEGIVERNEFEAGFRRVMAQMDEWWIALATESTEYQRS